jgi:hypothetical protein
MLAKMKIALGVPTFNRLQFVELHARSLCRSRLPSDTTIIVIDDLSTDYDVDFLKALFPPGSDIRRRSKNSGGADFAIRDLMEKLIETDADAMLILDSDMLVAENFLEVGAPLLLQSEGIISLFNTPSHPAYGSRGPFVLKRTIGSAASFWRREVAEKMLASVPPGLRWDWRFCAFLADAGYEIYVTRNSLVQHLGFADGANSRHMSGDYGVGFSDNTSQSSYALVEQAVLSSQHGIRHLLDKISSLQIRIDSLQDGLLRDELNEAKNRIEVLCRTVEAQQNLLSEFHSEGRRRIRRLERLLGLSLLDRLSRRLSKVK